MSEMPTLRDTIKSTSEGMKKLIYGLDLSIDKNDFIYIERIFKLIKEGASMILEEFDKTTIIETSKCKTKVIKNYKDSN